MRTNVFFFVCLGEEKRADAYQSEKEEPHDRVGASVVVTALCVNVRFHSCV